MHPMLTKRKRVTISLKDKVDIIERLVKGEKATDLAREYGVGTSTVSDIKRNSDSILRFVAVLDSEDISRHRRSMRNAENRSLEQALYSWYQEQRAGGMVVTGVTICEKAMELNKEINGDPNFKASSGWLSRFKTRHRLRGLQLDPYIKETTNTDFRVKLDALLHQINSNPESIIKSGTPSTSKLEDSLTNETLSQHLIENSNEMVYNEHNMSEANECFFETRTVKSESVSVDDQNEILFDDEAEIIDVKPEIHLDDEDDYEPGSGDKSFRTELLILAVRKRPGLWNYRLPLELRSKHIRKELWQEVYYELDQAAPLESLPGKFKNIRDTYMKLRANYIKKIVTDIDDAYKHKPTWKYWDLCHFLSDSIDSRKKQLKRKRSSNGKQTSNDDLTSSTSDDEDIPVREVHPTSHTTIQKVGAADHFCASLAEDLKLLSTKDRLALQIEILNLVHKALPG